MKNEDFHVVAGMDNNFNWIWLGGEVDHYGWFSLCVDELVILNNIIDYVKLILSNIVEVLCLLSFFRFIDLLTVQWYN